MARSSYNDSYRRPEVFFAELMQKYVRGELQEKGTAPPVLLRALVMAVDVVGGKLENTDPGSNDKVQHVLPNGKTITVAAQIGPRNPPNSIKARVLTDGVNQFYSDKALKVFWPFFPQQDSVPVNPGEHVYVIFEDPGMTHGLWISRVAGHENLNFYAGVDSYRTDADTALASKFDDTANAGSTGPQYNTEKEATESGIKNGNLAAMFDDTKDGDGGSGA